MFLIDDDGILTQPGASRGLTATVAASANLFAGLPESAYTRAWLSLNPCGRWIAIMCGFAAESWSVFPVAITFAWPVIRASIAL